jgi:biotin synthase
MNTTDLETHLRATDPSRLASLWAEADRVRRENVGEEVHLRGLVEISNFCVRSCGYCGIRAENRKLTRYRMSCPEVLECARQAVEYGYGTLVVQAGEDYGIRREPLAEMIRQVKAETPLAVTLSLGERPEGDLAAWREAGADRYLLRFETSDRALYDRIHPPRPGQARSDRFALLRRLRELGYEIGSGVMIGIPGQSYATLAQDIAMFRELDLDMIGVGPWLAHPETPLRGRTGPQHRGDDLQGRGAGAAGLPAGQYPQHYRSRHAQQGHRPGAGPGAGSECGHA